MKTTDGACAKQNKDNYMLKIRSALIRTLKAGNVEKCHEKWDKERSGIRKTCCSLLESSKRKWGLKKYVNIWYPVMQEYYWQLDNSNLLQRRW
jgi:hypothetical protein